MGKRKGSQPTVAVKHTKQRVQWFVIARLGVVEWKANAATVLVDLGIRLALHHARLHAMARIGADNLRREGQQCARLDYPHFGTATCRGGVGLKRAIMCGAVWLGTVLERNSRVMMDAMGSAVRIGPICTIPWSEVRCTS